MGTIITNDIFFESTKRMRSQISQNLKLYYAYAL